MNNFLHRDDKIEDIYLKYLQDQAEFSSFKILKNRENNLYKENFMIKDVSDTITIFRKLSEADPKIKIDNEGIARSLNSIFEKLLNAFNYVPIKMFLETNCYFAGGCIRSSIENNYINDYDIYFKNKEIADKFVELMNFEFEKKDNFMFKNDQLSLIVKTKNAITMHLKNAGTIQFITKYIGEPDFQLNNFDFSNCKAYFIPNSPYEEQVLNKIFVHPDMLWTLNHKAKCLKFNPKCWNPLNSMKRLLKFTKQGYNISNTELKKLMEAVKNATTDDFNDFMKKDY